MLPAGQNGIKGNNKAISAVSTSARHLQPGHFKAPGGKYDYTADVAAGKDKDIHRCSSELYRGNQFAKL